MHFGLSGNAEVKVQIRQTLQFHKLRSRKQKQLWIGEVSLSQPNKANQ